MSVSPIVLLGGKGVGISTPFINSFPWLPFPWNRPLHLFPPFNITTLIKPMNKEEEEAPLEDPCVRQNHLAEERHVARSEEQCVADASWRVAQRAMCNDVQIVTDASR